LLSAAAIFASFAPEAGKATEEKPERTTSFRSAASELANEAEAPMQSHSGNGSDSLGGGNEDELEQPGELPAGNPPADNAGAGSPSDQFAMPLDPNGGTDRILAGEDDEKKEDDENATDDEVGAWDVFLSWLKGLHPIGTVIDGAVTLANGVEAVTTYIDRQNESLAKQTGDDSYTKGG
jgi:hypothetical protein